VLAQAQRASFLPSRRSFRRTPAFSQAAEPGTAQDPPTPTTVVESSLPEDPPGPQKEGYFFVDAIFPVRLGQWEFVASALMPSAVLDPSAAAFDTTWASSARTTSFVTSATFWAMCARTDSRFSTSSRTRRCRPLLVRVPAPNRAHTGRRRVRPLPVLRRRVSGRWRRRARRDSDRCTLVRG
jgi:hypothetical protein